MIPRIAILMILLMSLTLAACSSPDPVSTNNSTDNENITSIPVMMINQSSDGITEGAGLMGIFSVSIDSSSLKGELSSIRNSSLDDALEMVDISNFLRLAPCADCAKLMGIEMDSDENIVLRIGIKHPFGIGDPLKPVSGRNRADLHVFNVEGTVIFSDSSSSTDFYGLSSVVEPSYLVNADGYSAYLDFAIDSIFPTEATLHPYILHFDDYSAGNFDPSNVTGFESVTTPPPTGNLVMVMGCDYDIKDYKFKVPDDESFQFMYAVGCTYAVSASSKSRRFSPEYQVPQHNKKAASEVSVEIVSDELTAGDTTSSAELLIKVLDISHGVAVGDASNEMSADSSVAAIYVEVPQVTSQVVTGNATPIGGDGRDPMNPLTFSLSFQNSLGAGNGIYRGLVKVLDSYPAGQNESPLLNGMDAIKAVDPIANPLSGLYSLSEFATYMTFDIEIGEASHTPVASFTTDPVGSPGLNIDFLDSVTFTSTSYDPDDPATPEGQIVLYEWDFEWDGNPANFIDQTAGAGTAVETHKYDKIAGNLFAGLRVTDGGTPPLTSEIYSVEVNVDYWSKDIVIDSNNGRIPKIAQMNSGNMMCIWSGADNLSHYSTWDGNWATKANISDSIPTTSYLSLDIGPDDNEAWASGGIYFFHYTGNPGPWTKTAGEIGSCVQTHIFSDGLDGFNVLQNSNAAFGWVVRIYWDSDTLYYANISYESIHYQPYNNRLLGESRIIDRNSQGNVLHVHKQDFAIDPYRPPQDLRYLVFARTYDPTQTGYYVGPIAQGADDILDSVTIACDTNDKIHVAYRNQPNGGGNYSILYKSSTDNGVSWGAPSVITSGATPPEYEYISIDTDSENNILVTYRISNNIYWLSSVDGSTWSAGEIVNESWPGGTTQDKEQFMVVDSDDRTHVVYDRCAAGATGYGPIMHRVRAPID
jgi:hypothetical protein